MSNLPRKIVIASIIVVLIMIGLFAQSFSVLPSKSITDNLYSVNNGFVNMYIYKTKSGYIAIDAGKDEKKIESELKKLGIDKEKITAVFLTHADNDHVGALKLFTNAKVYVGKEENEIIKGAVKRVYTGKVEKDCQTVSDNETVEIDGVKIKCIFTIGHTIGSYSYIFDDKTLFTGDNLSIKDGKADTFTKSYNTDTELQKQSIEKLAALSGIKYVFTAHNGYSDNYEKLFENWKK